MEIPDQLQCLFSASVEEQGGSHVIEIPEQEIQQGDLDVDDTYRVAILSSSLTGSINKSQDTTRSEPDQSGPPVEEGERRTVEIEDIGDQGDGITRVERGFVVIVPETDQGERVTVEITDVSENVAFAEVIKRLEYQG